MGTSDTTTQQPAARRLLTVALAAAAAACAHPPPPLRTTALVVRETSVGGVRPFVQADVGGAPTLLLLDTGAFQSMLPSQLARELGLQIRSNAGDTEFVDANGRRERAATLPDVPVRFEGEAEAGLMDFLMNPRPQATEAILAPIDLLRSGWALVIDIGRRTMTHEREEEAVARLRDAPSLRRMEFGGCPGEGLFKAYHRVVTAEILGEPTRMMIDTGAELTTLTRNSPALPVMLDRQGSKGRLLSHGSAGSLLQLDDVPIDFAGVRFDGPVAVSAASHPCWEGVIGADVLEHCTLVWGSRGLWAACRAPALDLHERRAEGR